MPGIMPKKKYYPGYQGGGVAEKNPISRGLGFLSGMFKDYAKARRRLLDEGRSLEHPGHPSVRRKPKNYTETLLKYGISGEEPPTDLQKQQLLRDIMRQQREPTDPSRYLDVNSLPKAAHGGVIPGYQAGGHVRSGPGGQLHHSPGGDWRNRPGGSSQNRPFRGFKGNQGLKSRMAQLGSKGIGSLTKKNLLGMLAAMFARPEEVGYSDEDREAFLRRPSYPTLDNIRETQGMEAAERARRLGGYDTGHDNPERDMILKYGQWGEGEESIADRVRRLRGRASGGMIPGYAPGGPVQQRMVQSYVSPEQAQLSAQLTGNIQNIASQPYQAYGGQRLAGTTEDQALARSAYGAYGRGTGPAGTQQAADAYTQAQGMVGGAAEGLQGLQPQYGQLAKQFGQGAQQAQSQSQDMARQMQQAGATAQSRGQQAGAGMRQTGTAAQREQQKIGRTQAQAGRAAQTEQQRLGSQQAAAGKAGQSQMAGLGRQLGGAGQGALTAQQDYATGMTDLGAQAGQAGQAGQQQFGELGQAAGALGQTAQRQSGQAARAMRGVGEKAGQPQKQTQTNLQDYMSQYGKGVTDPQLEALREFQQIQGQELGSQAATSGNLGSMRQGVQAAQQARDVSQQASDIIGGQQQKAFESAQQAFQADRSAKQQGLGQQLTAEQQAAQAQQAGVGAAQTAGSQQMQAAQQGQAAGQAGLSSQMQAQQQAAGMADTGAARQMQGLQGQGALTAQGIGMGQQGMAAQQSAALAGAGQRAQGLSAQQGAAAQGAQLGLQGQQQGYQATQSGAQQNLQGLQAAQSAQQQGYGTMGSMLGQQQGAIGAEGQAYGQMAQMGGQMAGIAGGMGTQAQREQQMQMQRLQGMEQAGARTQQEQQRDLDMGYQDFQAQRDHTQNQTQTALGMMNQLPYENTQVVSDYMADPGTMADLTSGLGLKEKLETGTNPWGENTEGTNTEGNENTTGAAGGGYVGESNAGLGIMGPLHKRIIDGLYAGGRISYR